MEAAEYCHQIRIASRLQIPFLATGGGHGTSSTLARLKQGIDIDLGKFDAVNLETDKNLLTVGGATVFSQVIDLLYAAGKELRKCSLIPHLFRLTLGELMCTCVPMQQPLLHLVLE